MQIDVVNGDLATQQVDTIVVPLPERTRRLSGATAKLDQALNGMLGELLSSGQVHGRANETTPFSTAGRIPATRVVVQGIGVRDHLTPDRIRQQTATLARTLRGMDAGHVASAGQGAALATNDAETAGRILAEAFTLGL